MAIGNMVDLRSLAAKCCLSCSGSLLCALLCWVLASYLFLFWKGENWAFVYIFISISINGSTSEQRFIGAVEVCIVRLAGPRRQSDRFM